jgi:LacI family transcriptional regulator
VGQWNPAEYDAVYSDDVQGAYDLTSHLISEGHRDIWFIGDTDRPWYARCSEGYRKCMQKAGLQPRQSEIHSDDRHLGYLAMRSIVSRDEPVTAVFAGSDPIARGVYDAVRQSGSVVLVNADQLINWELSFFPISPLRPYSPRCMRL